MADQYSGPYVPAAGSTPEQGMGDKFSSLLSDRNFLSLLAGMGSKFGAGGVGEMIGQPTQSLIQSMATQEALGKQENERKQWMQLLSGVKDKINSPDQLGPNKVTYADGKATIEMNTAGTPTLPTTENRTPATAAPSATPSSPAPTGRMNMSSALGFLRAPLVYQP